MSRQSRVFFTIWVFCVRLRVYLRTACSHPHQTYTWGEALIETFQNHIGFAMIRARSEELWSLGKIVFGTSRMKWRPLDGSLTRPSNFEIVPYVPNCVNESRLCTKSKNSFRNCRLVHQRLSLVQLGTYGKISKLEVLSVEAFYQRTSFSDLLVPWLAAQTHATFLAPN